MTFQYKHILVTGGSGIESTFTNFVGRTHGAAGSTCCLHPALYETKKTVAGRLDWSGLGRMPEAGFADGFANTLAWCRAVR